MLPNGCRHGIHRRVDAISADPRPLAEEPRRDEPSCRELYDKDIQAATKEKQC
jgi:hypothetical protein